MTIGAGGIGGGIGGGLSTQFDLLGTKGVGAGTGAGAGAGTTETAPAEGTAGTFGAVLRDKLASLNAEQTDANTATQDLAAGRSADLAQTMVRIEQANVSLQMATQVRNKVIEAYQEIIRMQI